MLLLAEADKQVLHEVIALVPYLCPPPQFKGCQLCHVIFLEIWGCCLERTKPEEGKEISRVVML